MILSMNHASFTVSSLDVSVKFYTENLGLQLRDISNRDKMFSEQVTGIPGAKLRIAYLKAPNCSVELVEYITPQGKIIDTSTSNVGSAHICFVVDEFDLMVEKLKKNGVRFSGEISIVPDGPNKGKKVLYFEDPDSNTIEFISSKPLE